jgi:tetratricopeptide (TPR) repeat protein
MRLIGPAPRGGVCARAGAADAHEYEFGDLLAVRRLLRLLEQGVPLRRLRSSVEALRERMPEVVRPAGALRVWLDGSSRVVLRCDGVLVEPDGQLVLELGVEAAAAAGAADGTAGAGGGAAPVASLEERRRGPEALRAELARREAEDWFEQGCRLDTDRATWAEAIEVYERALAADPEYADAHCNLGTIFFNQDRRGRARASFLRALEIEPLHLEANLNLASLCEEEGQLETALRHYKIALSADPLAADTQVSLALLYEKLELPRTARAHWQRYLRLDPDGAWAEVARRHLAR